MKLTINKTLPGLMAAGLLATMAGCSSNQPKTDTLDTLSLAAKPLKQGDEYLIMANRPNQIHVVDVASDSLYKSCPVPGDFGPGAQIMAPDHHTVYILSNHYKNLYGIDLDNCEVTFKAAMSQDYNERTISMYGFAVSPDGSELYVGQNPTKLYRDHYRVEDSRLAVYKTDAGLDAKPVRTFPLPRQTSLMMTGDNGDLYIAGADIYKMDVNSGEYEVAIPSRNWTRPLYAQPDVLAIWPIQTWNKDFTILYTTAKFQDESYDMNTAEWIYGYFNVDLESGETTTQDFAEFTEIYFTGIKSPTDDNIMYGVLNNLAKYDIKEKKLLAKTPVDHSYYCLAISKDGKKVYTGGTFNDLNIYDADSLKQIGKLELPGGDTAPTTLQTFIR
ncbi:quinohemoprotein amine dehydrogenase subunit beta [Oceanobacter mangrovi]|uniref:quinohemoprotein amine dehydrogenase subunit beta n=1 Tax=Oceanobacter mangrovi TaxID=2862510 RepID=UPI001FE93470|nr:quinohemoprotein amine dehydrogenase subunit beta [Oceanobacter mangrovi]